MFSAFFEAAYERLFDGSSLLCPVVHPEMDTAMLMTVGFIMSHAYLVAGLLPTRIAFPSLARMLLGMSVKIEDSVLLEAFISIHEASIVKEAVKEMKEQQQKFSSQVLSGLLGLLSRFNYRQIPIPQNLNVVLVSVAAYEFLSKPTAAISFLHSGIPEHHLSFWNQINTNDLFSLYQAQSVSAAMVLKIFEAAEGNNPSEERVLSYIRQFVGNMGSDELRSFLRFVTGGSVCSSLEITIEFNALSGAARRPIVHTCSPTLVLSSTYLTYPEFASEFRGYMTCEHSWIMDNL